jgi:hypothetical protein
LAPAACSSCKFAHALGRRMTYKSMALLLLISSRCEGAII